jgi:hypothetical protein
VAGSLGETVGRYVVRYADGSKIAIPIRYGENTGVYVIEPGSDEGSLEPAWQYQYGISPKGLHARLFLQTWRNPRPEVAIETLDFESAMATAGPFLVAITVEPAAPQ